MVQFSVQHSLNALNVFERVRTFLNADVSQSNKDVIILITFGRSPTKFRKNYILMVTCPLPPLMHMFDGFRQFQEFSCPFSPDSPSDFQWLGNTVFSIMDFNGMTFSTSNCNSWQVNHVISMDFNTDTATPKLKLHSSYSSTPTNVKTSQTNHTR